jgi:glutamine---fructose-6-phosphate transaminase (isomerizing)
MCGIVCGITKKDIVPIMLNGLKILEYRGYDSAGMAALDHGKYTYKRIRKQGKVIELEKAIESDGLTGQVGISQTRWATHGKPSEENAHPHISGDLSVVHNGIIENYLELRAQLKEKGYVFKTETDTEVIPHLIHYQLSQQSRPNLLEAVYQAKLELEGAFALGIMSSSFPDELIGVRQGSPLVVGAGANENFLASDTYALIPYTQDFIYLEEGDIAHLLLDQVVVYDHAFQKKKHEIRQLPYQQNTMDRGEYRHFMQKEIFEQPVAAKRTLLEKVQVNALSKEAVKNIDAQLSKVKRVHIIACGTSYHAGLVGKYWIEEFAKLPCHVEVASEYRYRALALEPDTLFLSLSQSGETADTLGALHKAKTLNYLNTLSICNVPHSAMTRLSDFTLLTSAGIEVGVASTKAFIAQLIALLMLVPKLGSEGKMKEDHFLSVLEDLPGHIEKMLTLNDAIQALANVFLHKTSALFLGRGVLYPIALEGALKLKELSYIHAEAYPSGELKHGPLALIDEQMPVVALVSNNHLLAKLQSNLDEVRARGGQLVLFVDETLNMQSDEYTKVVKVPSLDDTLTSPILYAIPMQLLAYHVAVLKGTDVDQPRNLAKSVTVE